MRCCKVAMYRARALGGEFDVSVKTSASSSGGIANPTVIATCQPNVSVNACFWKNGLSPVIKREGGRE